MARLPLSPDAYLTHLAAAVADVAAVLESGDLDAPVPACAPWRLTDLTHHLGGIHRWARGAVVGERVDSRTVDDAPVERAALVSWFREGADDLIATLASTDPETPCWTFGPAPRTVAFWLRRQAHETAAHAGDAAASQGATRPYGIELALDGIDETVAMFFPRQVRLGRIPPLAHAVAVAPDEGGRWVLAGDGTTPPADAEVIEAGAVEATVSGPAEDLLRLLWHRTTLDNARLTISGNRRAADAVLTTALTP